MKESLRGKRERVCVRGLRPARPVGERERERGQLGRATIFCPSNQSFIRVLNQNASLFTDPAKSSSSSNCNDAPNAVKF